MTNAERNVITQGRQVFEDALSVRERMDVCGRIHDREADVERLVAMKLLEPAYIIGHRGGPKLRAGFKFTNQGRVILRTLAIRKRDWLA
jgi:hypothetical protein